jgi:lactoylglutathione lyase
MHRQLFPIIATTDLPRALGFYRDLLGGTVVFEFPGPDGKPAYVGIDLGESHLGIGQDPTAPGPDAPKSISLWIYTDDCDAAIEALRAGGVTITAEPADQPWGERLGRVRDFDGNEVILATKGTSAT